MRYHLDTIPVIDAYERNGECPLCDLKAQMERQYTEYFLGGSVMEPDSRIEINDKGFCREHLRMLYMQKNRLGLSLLMDTHAKARIEKMKDAQKPLERALANASGGLTGKILPGKKASAAALELAAALRREDGRCAFCDRMRENMQRYTFTILHLYGHEFTFAQKMRASRGFCLVHMADILEMAATELPAERQRAFFKDLLEIQRKQLERLEGELFYFTQKFDYRNAGKPWGDSKTALARTIDKLKSSLVGDEEA